MANSTIRDNSGFNGGGIYNDNLGRMTLYDVTLDGNSQGVSDVVGSAGGGILNGGGAVLTVLDSTISDNSAANGGGILNAAGATLILSNCTVSGNNASERSSPPTDVLTGGGINNAGTLTLLSTIVADNFAFTADADLAGGGLPVQGGNNVIGDANGLAGTGLVDGSNGNSIGHAALLALFGSADDYGGPLRTVALLPGSPALGAGGALTTVTQAAGVGDTTIHVANASAIASTPGDYFIVIDGEELAVTNVDTALNTLMVTRGSNGQHTAFAVNDPVFLFADQRGLERPAGLTDIGAFESQGFTLTINAGGTPQSAQVNSTFVNPLQVTVTANDPAIILPVFGVTEPPVDGGVITFTVTLGGGGQGANLSSGSATIKNLQAGVTARANGFAGAYTVTASSGRGSAIFQLTNTAVGPAPVFTSDNSATFTVGSPGSFTLAVDGTPAPTFSESDADTLPGNVSFDPTTGTLHGNPATGSGGIYTLHFTAHNGAGADATQTFTLTVDEAPSFNGADHTSFTEGQSGIFALTVGGFPRPVVHELNSTFLKRDVGLIQGPGNSFSIEGIPVSGSAGDYTFNFSADNGIGGPAMQTFTFHVLPEGVGETIVVTNTADKGDGSLRAAIHESNLHPGVDTIVFDIPKTDPGFNPATGTYTIFVGTGLESIPGGFQSTDLLPGLLDAAVIDGTTQPGFAGKPVVQLFGIDADPQSGGLTLVSGCTVRGLIISNFAAEGIEIIGDHNTVQGCYIGTDGTGTVALSNENGIVICDGQANDNEGDFVDPQSGDLFGGAFIDTLSASFNTIGGTTPADQNIISGYGDFANLSATGLKWTASAIV